MKSALLALPLVIVLLSPASAQQDVAAFYKGKTMRIVVGAGVGSGYDLSARAIARHLSVHIPGNPTVIVQNLAGAGSLTMTNQLFTSGPFDGTVIGAPNNGVPAAALLQQTGVRFDPRKLSWIASSNRETQITYVWHTAPVQSLTGLFTKPLIVAAQQPGVGNYDFPVLANALFGTKFKVITGYESTPKIHLAMESGEIEGNGANWSTLKTIIANWIDEKKVKLLAQWALRPHPELPSIPNMFDLASNEAERAAMRLVMTRLEIGRPFFLPPNVPAERVQALRRAFDATMKDAAFLVEVEKLKIDIDPLTGEQVAALVDQVMGTPSEVTGRVRAALDKK
jgi:tripartite-type tricarboxylate transporter receptor subunit TctC